MALTTIQAPPLGDVAQGVAGLWAIEAQGFSPDGNLLLVKVVYTDSAYPSVATRSAFWTYDLRLGQYSASINKLVASDRPLEVSDVVIANDGAQTQWIVSYRDTGATALNLNKLALVRNGVLLQSDLVLQVTGYQADAMIDALRVSADGRFVAIETAASNLTAELDTNGCKDIYVFDLVLNTSRRITSINGAESLFDGLLGDVLIGADGGLSVAFQSAQAFTSQDSNASDDVFVWHLAQSEFGTPGAGTVSLVSRTNAGAAGATNPQLNLNGTVFTSDSGAFSAADQNITNDVWQSVGNSVVLVPLGASGTLTQASSLASSSDTGKFVAVVTASPEIAGQTGVDQLVVVDTVAHSQTIVSKSAAGALADDAVISPVLSADGTRVAFSSQASNLGAAADGQMHLYYADFNKVGVVSLGGTPTQGQTLTVSATDADGLASSVSYQWQADGSDISGATASTLALTEAQVGKAITVVASYVDGNGRAEAVTSNPGAAVANVNDAPTGSVSLTGTATQGETLSAANTLADLDGIPSSGAGSISYQWFADAGAIVGATGNTLLLTQAQVGKVITGVASYTDGHGTTESVSSSGTVKVANVDDKPTGAIVLASYTAAQGQTLTTVNTLADPDGMGTITYQWKADGVAIGGATSDSFLLTEAQVGKAVSVEAIHTDAYGGGFNGLPLLLRSTMTAPVANVNDLPAGTVTFSGAATQGQTLTAANTLADADGLGTISYQWIAGGTPISGATAISYVLTQAEVGKTIKVAASYTDGHGTAESVSSDASTAVANVNDAPTGTLTITGTADQGETLKAMNTVADADGLAAFSYQWSAGASTISGATTDSVTLGQAEVGKTITVAISYTDAYGAHESVASTATNAVANVNDAPTGLVSIGGTATQGQTLTASNTLADIDGLGSISYQWSAAGIAISGATSSTLVLSQSEVGKTITVKASFTDGFGTHESVSSTATDVVANVNDAPTGAVSITGIAGQGQTISASSTLSDLDGIPASGAGAIRYQWYADGVAISGATADSVSLSPADVGKAYSVTASYIDGFEKSESVTSSAVVVSAGKTVDLLAYTWKTHTLLDGVSVSGAGQSTTTDAIGAASLTAVTEPSVSLTVNRPVPSAEASATSSAVNLQDAIAILKMIVGLPVNGANQPVSPYQTLAADFDGNGSVGLTDAIGVLKHVVGLAAPDPTWHFVNEADTSVPSKTTLSPGTPQATVTADLSGTSPVHVGLVGYLSGDVDGSYAGPAGALDLDVTQPTYIATLVGSHPGLTAAQFGVVG